VKPAAAIVNDIMAEAAAVLAQRFGTAAGAV